MIIYKSILYKIAGFEDYIPNYRCKNLNTPQRINEPTSIIDE